MHIFEGVLSVTPHGQEVWLGGAAVAAVGTAIGLYKMDYERIPRVAVLSSTFFVASLISVPMGPTSVHMVLNGLMGLVLGWCAFPAVLVALVLQAVMFSIGGPTTLGVNTVIMALPAVMCHYLFRYAVQSRYQPAVFAGGFAAGALGILLGATLNATALSLAATSFEVLAQAVWLWHLPVALIEGLVTGSVVVFLRKVRPEVLDAPFLAPAPQEAFLG
jgi:cobalt/nickel transport system permease protein